MMSDLICVGTIAGAFGVQGEVRLKSFTADPTAIADYAPLSNEDGTQIFSVTLTRPINNGFAARLGGVKTKEEADALKGVKLFAEREKLPELPDDEFYHTDLIGLEVYDTGGTLLGRIKAVMNHGAGDILEVTSTGNAGSVLLPFTLDIVPTVDLTAGRIVADPPEGLF
jgi:16S rRNA processing protein RimM